jgi:hypothetical protein
VQLAISAALAGPAAAATSTFLVLSPDQPTSAAIGEDPSLLDRTTFDLRITTSADWSLSALSFNLTAGTFYNAADGGNVPTTPGAWSTPGSTHLRYDTFVAAPVDFTAGVFVAGKNPADGSGAAVFATNAVSVQWLDTVVTAPGTYTIARVTVSNDAVGSFYGNSFDGANAGLAQPFNGALSKQLRWDTVPTTAGDQGGAGTWDTAGSNFWNGATNVAWQNARNDVAIFAGSGAAVAVSGSVTASALEFDSPGYSLAGGTVALSGATRLIANQDVTINSSITSPTGLAKSGGAAATLGGSLTALGGTVRISAGRLIVNGALAGTALASVNIGNAPGGATALLSVNSLTAPLVTVNSTGTLKLTPSIAHTLSTATALSLSGSATADVGQADLLTSTPAATIRAYLINSYDPNGNADWAQPGLTSSIARSNPVKYTVGYANGNDASSQDARPDVLPGTVLVRPTLTGDANLDGKVDFFDIAQILGYAYNTGQPASYTDGDLDYNGKVDFFDITLVLSSNYNTGETFAPVATFPAIGQVAAVVPEPVDGLAGLAELALGLTAVGWRHYRRPRRGRRGESPLVPRARGTLPRTSRK